MEKWDLYTKYREKSGKEQIRGEKIPNGFYHLVVHVWIRNCKGEYLISQRSVSRPTFPLMWECVGGSVLMGESSIDGALREVKEEVGLDLQPEAGKLLFTKIRGTDVKYECKEFNDIMDVWLFEYDGDLHLEDATTDEVADCKWMTVSEIRKLYGYVNNVLAGDGAEQDVYIFGTNKPLKSFRGKVVAVWHRFDDVEDKWIVSLNGEDIAEEKILGDISFQEQFFYGKLYK